MSTMLPINKVVESVSITHKYDKPVLKFLNTSDVENGKIININHLPIDELKGQAKKTIQKHDILFSEIRPKNRRFAYVDIDDTYDYVVSTRLMVLRNINPEVDNKYFYYFLTNDHMLSILQDRAENRIGSFPQITFDLLSEYYIRVPKLAEQQKIASVLSALDSKIELNNRINAELEAMAKTLYDYWFVQFDFPDKNGKPYKTSGGKMVWNEELKREIPEGWEDGTLGDIAELVRGVTYDSSEIKSENDHGVIPILRATNVSGNVIDLNDMVYVPKENVSTIQVLNKYDILITMSSGSKDHIGKNGFFYYDKEVAFGAFCAKIVAKDEYRFYLYSYTQSDFMFTTIKNECLGTNINNLNGSLVKGFKIVIPPKEFIKLFNEKVIAVYEKIGSNLIENQKLTELRDWLLPMLMNGQVKVN